MRSENEIISDWEEKDSPVVSIQCITYNHENYIRQAIEGFLSQETNFPFEVIIHDDASTDNTAKIIKEYEEQYPNIIIPIYQTENQYSKKVDIQKTFVFPIIKGKYIAICEGDDYWTDSTKLQKQYDFMEANPDYSLCVHTATFHYCNQLNRDYTFPEIEQSKEYSIEEIIMGDGDLFSTNTVFVKREVLIDKPECFCAWSFGDYQLFMYSSMSGKVYCLADNMAVYNHAVEGSWSSRIWYNSEQKIKHIYDKIHMLENIDEYYDKQYHDIIDKKIIEDLCTIYETEENKEKLSEEPFRSMYKNRKINRVKGKLITKFPHLYKTMKRFKK